MAERCDGKKGIVATKKNPKRMCCLGFFVASSSGLFGGRQGGLVGGRGAANEHFASKNLKVDTVFVLRPQFVWWVGFVVQSLAGLLWAQKTHRPVRQRDKASS
jgi:hypothetical protein